MASLSNTLLMIPRELPSYLKVAYSLRYADEPNTSRLRSPQFKIIEKSNRLSNQTIRRQLLRK